jgi:hypothetical protein
VEIFVYRPGGLGPLEMTEPLKYDLSLLDAALLKQVESAGVSAHYITRLIGIR